MKSSGAALRRGLDRVHAFSTRHPRRVAATVATLLCGWGVTAFGVAPLTVIDPATVPVHKVEETVRPLGLQAQLDALDLQALALHRTDQTRGSDTIESLLARLGVDDPEAASFLRTDATARQVLQGRPGKLVQATVERDATGVSRLKELTVLGPAARSDTAAEPAIERHYTHLSVTRDAAGLHARSEQRLLAVQTRVAFGQIESSLFAAADEAQVPDVVTMQLAEVFGSDIDFRRDLRQGDHFSVLYEVLTAAGQPITWGASAGRMLAARFVNKGDAVEAYWFEPAGGGKGGYFGADGRSRSRAFLGSPLAFSRVSSGFSMRFHPILQTWRAHLGVDYAAPTGTAVRTVGNGVVSFAGRQNGYGNVVEVRHDNQHVTLYAHLSRIDVRQGQRVDQGDRIGAVGATGWATGPHLHFEFKLAGKQVDPLKVAKSSEGTLLTAQSRPQFMLAQRAAADLLAAVEPAAQAAAVATAAVAAPRARME